MWVCGEVWGSALLYPLSQGAVVGLLAGLAMAFWIGIGSILTGTGGAKGVPPANSTALPTVGNLSTILATTLPPPTSAPPR